MQENNEINKIDIIFLIGLILQAGAFISTVKIIEKKSDETLEYDFAYLATLIVVLKLYHLNTDQTNIARVIGFMMTPIITKLIHNNKKKDNE